ncbi:MAG TPA: hypothetical protein VH164_00215 [Ktedonobacteraceae bacterium]|jgi:hypothetical protein|nr:hypothetical protein [Ktedonobacteraceae bacterium]
MKRIQQLSFEEVQWRERTSAWLYVMLQYTSAPLKERHLLSVAPDTHVIQASVALGLVQKSGDLTSLRTRVARAWVLATIPEPIYNKELVRIARMR